MLVPQRSCVIGAGAAGLATVHALRRAGHEFDCFEASDRVGGHWHTDYDNLHLITPRDGSGFRGDPMPEDWPHFPRRAQMVEYLEGYADRHGLRDHITFGTRVERLDAIGNGARHGWDVTTSDGTTRRYAAALVANGHNSVPSVPPYEGSFTGPMMHSVEFTNAGRIQGERVLVVGSGNSGCDIAAELAQTGHDVVMSIRAGHLFQPKTFFGKPRGSLRVMKLPPRLMEPVLRGLIRMAVGPPERYGLPAPESKALADQRPVVNSLVLHWIHHGRILPKPGIRRFDGTTVEFVDGSTTEVDTVIWATGFRAALPFLSDEHVHRRDGIPLRVAGCTLPYEGPSRLYYIGLCAPRGPQLPVYSDQAEVVMDMLRLQERLDEPLASIFSAREEPEARIDIVRSTWNEQMDATRRLLLELDAAAASRPGRPSTAPETSSPVAVGGAS